MRPPPLKVASPKLVQSANRDPNRDPPFSASAGVRPSEPVVLVTPRASSDPGDSHSDLGSDAGWQYTMASDSDADEEPHIDQLVKPDDHNDPETSAQDTLVHLRAAPMDQINIDDNTNTVQRPIDRPSVHDDSSQLYMQHRPETRNTSSPQFKSPGHVHLRGLSPQVHVVKHYVRKPTLPGKDSEIVATVVPSPSCSSSSPPGSSSRNVLQHTLPSQHPAYSAEHELSSPSISDHLSPFHREPHIVADASATYQDDSLFVARRNPSSGCFASPHLLRSDAYPSLCVLTPGSPEVQSTQAGILENITECSKLMSAVRDHHLVESAHPRINDQVPVSCAGTERSSVSSIPRRSRLQPPVGISVGVASTQWVYRLRHPAESFSSVNSSRPGSPASGLRTSKDEVCIGTLQPLIIPSASSAPATPKDPAVASGTSAANSPASMRLTERASPHGSVCSKTVSLRCETGGSPLSASMTYDRASPTQCVDPDGTSTSTALHPLIRRPSLRRRVAPATIGRRYSHASCDDLPASLQYSSSPGSSSALDPCVPQRERPRVPGRYFSSSRPHREIHRISGHSRACSAESWSKLVSLPSNSSSSSYLSADIPSAAGKDDGPHTVSVPRSSHWMRLAQSTGFAESQAQRVIPTLQETLCAAHTDSPTTHSQALAVKINPISNDRQQQTVEAQAQENHACGTSPVPAGKAPLVFASPAFFETATTATSNVIMDHTKYSVGSSPLFPALGGRSFLECLVVLLKGSSCFKRRSIVKAIDCRIWLCPDMITVKFRTRNKKVIIMDEFLVSNVRKIRATDRDISITVENRMKNLDFNFASIEETMLWLCGLCCLVPAKAIVKSRYNHLEQRESYEPWEDSWEGKPLQTLESFNEYVLLGTIGRGSFGKVRLALSRSNRQFYAVKVLSKSVVRKQNRNAILDPFLQDTVHVGRALMQGSESVPFVEFSEVVIMKKLKHPNIVKLLDLYDDAENDLLYIVVEFVPCGPILSSSKTTKSLFLPESRAREIFVDVLAGLQYLHRSGIVHRDIKPDNLLQAGDGSVKLSDFGSAICYYDSEKAGDEDRAAVLCSRTMVGTPAFTAPELCLSTSSPPAPTRCYSADIWSLGATLFYMLYGHAPFYAKSVFEMYHRICSQPLEFPDAPKTSKQVRNLLTDMLEKSPEKRASLEHILSAPWLHEACDLRSRISELIQINQRNEGILSPVV